MDKFILVLLGLGILLVVDLLTIAARSGLRNASLTHVLQLQDQGEQKAENALALMGMLPRPYAGLHLLQSFSRFLLFGGLLLFITQSVENLALWAVIGILLLVGLVVALAEWVVERLIARRPEIWIIRLNSFIRFVNFILYPLASLALLFTGDSKSTGKNLSKVTEDELITLVDASEQNGIIEQDERQMKIGRAHV